MKASSSSPVSTRGQGGYPALKRLAQAFSRPVWVVDLEATGGDLSNPEFGVVEIGWVLVREDGSWEERSFLTDPGFPMDPYAQRLTGIERSMYQGEPALAQRWAEVGPLFFETVVCGFGVEELDCKALAQAARQNGHVDENVNIRSLDARKLWTKKSGSNKGRLAEVAKTFGHEGISHRALDDARACARALDGLVESMGLQVAMSLSRHWFPGRSVDTASEASRERGASVEKALPLAKKAPSFEEGLKTLAAAGVRAHWSPKGLSWWVQDQRAESDLAPRNIAELGAHFGCAVPSSMSEPDSLARCRAMFGAKAAQGGPFPSDDEVSLLCACRSASSAGTARMNMIRSGELAPWTGVDDATRELACALASGAVDESKAIALLRQNAPESMRAHQLAGVCAASIAAQLRAAPKAFKP
jgi:DNA polymerase III epsilon subunit-like protein